MAIRLPLKVVLSQDSSGEVGAGSVNGFVPYLFTIPQDTDNIVVKVIASTGGGGVSAQLQTTDDGGNTWYGVARTSIVSLALGDAAEWFSVPVSGFGYRSSGNAVASVGSHNTPVSVLGTIGNAAPSTLGQKSYSGMPILSQQARIVLQLQSSLDGTPNLTTQVKVNSQSATA